MGIFDPLILKHSIEIATAPEKIWEFFANLDTNYTTWHPEDHVVFRWIEGKPLEVGARFYSEQYAMGEIHTFKGYISKTMPNRKIVMKFDFPISIVTPKIEWLLEPKDSNTIFTAITYYRLGKLCQKLFKKHTEKIIVAHDKHVGAEGENLKRILEAT